MSEWWHGMTDKEIKKVALQRARRFDQRVKVINMYLREFLTEKFVSPAAEDIEEIRKMQTNAEQLAIRAANLARELTQDPEEQEKQYG